MVYNFHITNKSRYRDVNTINQFMNDSCLSISLNVLCVCDSLKIGLKPK